MNIVSVVGARPSFVKVAPLAWHFEKSRDVNHTIIHTGQHYDEELYSSFFKTLGIPSPRFDLGVGSGNHGRMTGDIMRELENILKGIEVDWVVVYGASNSSMAGALTAAKLGLNIAHIESGLRTGMKKHPEEINRRVAETVSDLLFATGTISRENLVRDGIPESNIVVVGNLMVDALIRFLPVIKERQTYKQFDVECKNYILVTMHQPYNVDDKKRFSYLIDELLEISETLPILFSLHPRTSHRLSEFNLLERLLKSDGVRLIAPQDYLDFLSLVECAKGLITDSGGIADETTYLGIPCLTLRPSVERAITVTIGTNEQVDTRPGALLEMTNILLEGKWKEGKIPELWDGKTASRIANALIGMV